MDYKGRRYEAIFTTYLHYIYKQLQHSRYLKDLIAVHIITLRFYDITMPRQRWPVSMYDI